LKRSLAGGGCEEGGAEGGGGGSRSEGEGGGHDFVDEMRALLMDGEELGMFLKTN
jgi:hypothetical protein